MQTRMNKWFGLKKLRKIAGKDPRWNAPKTIVLKKGEHYRESQRNGLPRLLVRTDEKGKRYQNLSWGSMPRTDILSHEANESMTRFVLEKQRRSSKDPKNTIAARAINIYINKFSGIVLRI